MRRTTVLEFFHGFGAYSPMPSNPVRTCRRVSALRREQPHLRVVVLVCRSHLKNMMLHISGKGW
jgi:hypothetical protein